MLSSPITFFDVFWDFFAFRPHLFCRFLPATEHTCRAYIHCEVQMHFLFNFTTDPFCLWTLTDRQKYRNFVLPFYFRFGIIMIKNSKNSYMYLKICEATMILSTTAQKSYILSTLMLILSCNQNSEYNRFETWT